MVKEQEQSSEQQTASIHGKLFSGSVFMLLTRLIVKGIGLISSIILARLLVPEDFGLVAIATAVFAFIELFGAFGLETALIQRQTKCENDYNTAWTFKVGFGLFTALVLLAIAPLVAEFYKDPRLTEVIWVISLTAFLGGLSNIGVVDFQTNLDFRRELKFQVIPKLLSFCVTVTLAFTLRNYWALVFGMLASQAIRLIASYVMHPYRPKFSLASVGALFSFSKWLLLNNVLFYVNTRLTELVLGRILSPAAVGVFSIGNEIASMPTTEMAAPINRASFPVYSKFKENLQELKRAYKNTVALSSGISVPAAVGIFAVCPLFVEVVLGEAWMAAVPLMQWIALGSVLMGLSTNIAYVFMALGKPYFSFIISLLRALAFLPLLLLWADEYGLPGVGKAFFITSGVMFIASQISIMWLLRLSIMDILMPMIRPLLGSLVLVIAVEWTLTFSLPAFLALLVAIVTGMLSYALASWLSWLLFGKPEGIEKVVADKYFSSNSQ